MNSHCRVVLVVSVPATNMSRIVRNASASGTNHIPYIPWRSPSGSALRPLSSRCLSDRPYIVTTASPWQQGSWGEHGNKYDDDSDNEDRHGDDDDNKNDWTCTLTWYFSIPPLVFGRCNVYIGEVSQATLVKSRLMLLHIRLNKIPQCLYHPFDLGWSRLEIIDIKWQNRLRAIFILNNANTCFNG